MNYAEIRNALVNGGEFPKKTDPLRVTYSLLEAYQRLLLAILNYRGMYVDCSLQPFIDRLFELEGVSVTTIYSNKGRLAACDV